MASLTATTLPALGIVKLVLNWAPYVNEPVSIFRVEPDGTQVEILGSPLTLSGSDAVAYDTTAPLDVNLTYKAVLANPEVVRDAFNRTPVSSNGWGTPDFTAVAGPWTVVGTASNYSTGTNPLGSGTDWAYHTHTSVNVARISVAPGTYSNVRVSSTIQNTVMPTGAPTRLGVVTRYVDANNHYQFNAQVETSGLITLQIIKRSGGTDTVLVSKATSLSFVVGAGKTHRLIGQSVGNRHTITLWEGTPANVATVDVVDTAFTSGQAGARSLLNSGNTNTLSVNLVYDNFLVEDLSTFTVTSGAVNVATAPHGWLRDPFVPGNSIRLDNCASHTFDCLNGNQMVFFQGFGDVGLKSSTGVFAVNNSALPTTVAQLRKGPVVDLRFASVSLTDITRVRTLFSSGRDLSLYLPDEYGWGVDSYGTQSFTAGDLTEARLNRTDMRKPYRLWSVEIAARDLDDDLPHYTVGTNGNIPIPGATIADLKATGKTIRQLNVGTPLNSNPYFEGGLGTTGWTSFGGSIAATTAQFHEGTTSLLLTPNGVAVDVEATFTGYVTVAAGKTVRYTAWLRCAVARSVDLVVVWSNGTTETGSASVTTALAANTWTRVDGTAVAPAGTVRARLGAQMHATPLASHLLYIDEAILSTPPTVQQVEQGVFA